MDNLSDGVESLLSKLSRLLISEPLRWGAQLVSGYDVGAEDVPQTSPSFKDAIYLIDLLNETASKVANKLAANDSKVFTRPTFFQVVNDIREKELSLPPIRSASDMDYLLKFMSNLKMISVKHCQDSSLEVIKYLSHGKDEINDEDLSTIYLSEAIKRLMNMIQDVEKEKEACKLLARKALSSGDRLSASHHVRRKLFLQKVQDQHVPKLSALQDLIHTIETTKVNMEVYSALESGNKALKAISERSDLTPENIDNLIDDIRQEITAQDHIARMLAEPDMISDWDDSALENELEEILKSEPVKVESPGNLTNLAAPRSTIIQKQAFEDSLKASEAVGGTLEPLME